MVPLITAVGPIVCFAQADRLVRLTALAVVSHRHQLIPEHLEFSFDSKAGRLGLVTAAVNLVRILITQSNAIPIWWTNLQPDMVIDRTNLHSKTRITISSPHYVIQRLPVDQQDRFRRAYRVFQNARHAVQAETLDGKNMNYAEFRLQPVGVHVVPRNLAELSIAIQHVLEFLVDIAVQDFVHGDLRWPNVLKEIMVEDPN